MINLSHASRTLRNQLEGTAWSARGWKYSSFNPNSELHLSLSAAAMSSPKPEARFSAEHWGDPSKSELSTQPNSSSSD